MRRTLHSHFFTQQLLRKGPGEGSPFCKTSAKCQSEEKTRELIRNLRGAARE